jgi:Domain of unknown function (DUF222)/HNH endonuclease
MFDVVQTSNFPTEPPLELTAPEDLVDELAAVFARRDRDEARAAVLLAKARETRAFERDGYSSLTAMLKHRMSLHPGEAQRLVRRASALDAMPLTSLAHDRGALSGAQVDVMVEVRALAPIPFDEAEGRLVELAMDTPLVALLRKRLDYWLDQVARDELNADRNLLRDLRSLRLHRDGDMMRINGWVDIETGEQMRSRLEPGPPTPGDDRSTPARRADVLIDILNGAGDRSGLTVHVSAETLFEGKPGISETEYGTFLTTDEISRISCDANLTRVVFGPDSQPLDVGRTKRLVTPALRVAVVARDLHCIFPGCERPASWCDIHHLIPWSEGGPTSLDNLVMLCRHHHTLVHEGGWRIQGTPGHLSFYRPDGSQLDADPLSRPLPTALPSTQPKRPPSIDIKTAIQQIRAIPYPRAP